VCVRTTSQPRVAAACSRIKAKNNNNK